jgi:hypothetical protein
MMIRTRTLLVTAAITAAMPFAAAMAGPMGPEPMQPSPMQGQEMAAAPSMAPMPSTNGQCMPGKATMKDEYGRKYDCRGDRVR